VVAVHIEDNQPVKAGDLLVELDPTDLEVALAQARAATALAEAQLRRSSPAVPITETFEPRCGAEREDEVKTAGRRPGKQAARAGQIQAGARFAQQQMARCRAAALVETIPQAE